MKRAEKFFVQYLRDNNLKVTKERLMLLEELFGSSGHLDADSLLFQLRSQGKHVSRATIYRTLDLLVQCGLARKSRLGREHYVYEKVTPGKRHDHMVCTGCGQSTPVGPPWMTHSRAYFFDPSKSAGLASTPSMRVPSLLAQETTSSRGSVQSRMAALKSVSFRGAKGSTVET